MNSPIRSFGCGGDLKNLWISGGIRNGLDGAKTIWLGANMFGMAGELLKVLENIKLEID